MSRENGQLRTCDRCGTQMFFRCTGEGEADGGYTRWNEFEYPTGWGVLGEIGDVCPTCMREYVEILERFKKKPPQTRE